MRVCTVALGLFIALMAVFPGFGPGAWSGAILLVTGIATAGLVLLPLEVNSRAILLIAASALSVLLAEGGARIMFGPDFESVYDIDERYLHRLVPGTAKRFHRTAANGGGVIDFRVSREGYRGEDLAALGGGRRIVVYGDSFIAAEFSRREDSFTEKLRSKLEERDPSPLQIINAGVVAYGPDQVSLRMADELPRLKPQLAIVAVFAGNDFGELMRNKIFKLDSEGNLRRHEFQIDPALRARFARARRSLVLSRMTEKALYRLAAGEQATAERAAAQVSGRGRRAPRAAEDVQRHGRVENWLWERREEYERYVGRNDDSVTDLLGDGYDADVSMTPGSASALYKVQLMDRVLLHIRTIAEKSDVPLLLLIIPSPIDASERYEHAQVDAEQYPEYERSALSDALEQIAARHGIPHVNLFEPFTERDAHTLYFKGGDDHWNDAGQELAAQLVAEYLDVSGLLDETPD